MECNTGRVINLSSLSTRFQGLRDRRKPKGKRYAAYMEQKGFASLTRKRKIVAIRSFLSFLYQEGDIDTNIANKVVLPFNETTIARITVTCQVTVQNDIQTPSES